MKKTQFAAVFAAALSLTLLLRADDTVLLNDGSVLKGQVMEETSDHVVLMDHGIQRTLQRGLVAKVSFNTDPGSDASSAAPDGGNASSPAPAAAPAAAMANDGGNAVPEGPADGGTVPVAPTQEQQDYALGVSNYYQIPSDQVWGFEQQGIPYEELPVVFYVARRAQCAPGEVVSMRLSGMSWADICAHFALGPGIFYWHDVFSANLGGPYSGIYFRFGRYPHRRWAWNVLALSDADIINCVNLRFSTAYWHLTPFQVARWRGLGHPYFWGGYYRGRAYGHAGGWGHGGPRGGQRGQWGGGHGDGGGRQPVRQGGDGGDRGGDRGQWSHN